jgi:SPP1 family predicted phage head-tail adaptor
MAQRPVVQIGDGGWPILDIGRLNRSITFLRLGPSSPPQYDAAGPVMSWQTSVPDVMASIETMRGTDVIRSGQTTAQIYLEVTIWYQDGITSDMRIANGGNTYVIQSIENVNERDRVLRLNCVALGANE